MHPALALPEVVAAIVNTNSGPDSLPFLHSCLFINKLFALEASRILWADCGAGHCGYSWRRNAPRIRHLVRMLADDPTRAQFYANFIRHLSFGLDKSLPRAQMVGFEEQKWHGRLAHLKFPALERLQVQGSTGGGSAPLVHYLHGHLKELWLMSTDEPCDEFLQELLSRSPKLKVCAIFISTVFDYDSEGVYGDDEGSDQDDDVDVYLELYNQNLEDGCSAKNNVSNLSAGGLAHFLEHSRSLSSLYLSGGLEHVWSSRALAAIANNPSLKHVTMPDISCTITGGLEKTRRFQALESLKTGIAEGAINDFLPYLRQDRLMELDLDQERFPPAPWSALDLSQFSRLQSLLLQLHPDCQIQADQLLLLAKSCPTLQTLQVIPGGFKETLLSNDVTDTTVIEISQLLPQLRCFTLRLHPIALTEKAFLALCKNSQGLEQCEMTANIDYRLIIDQGPSPFSHLTSLTFYLPGNRERVKNVDPNTMARSLKSLMPNLHQFYLFRGSEVDRAIWASFRAL